MKSDIEAERGRELSNGDVVELLVEHFRAV